MAYTHVIDAFIPELWSAELDNNWDQVNRMVAVTNRSYEGEVKAFGDVLHIPAIGNVTVSDYDNTATPPISSYEDVEDSNSDLNIDERSFWAFKVQDIEQAQANIKGLQGKNINRAMVAMNDTVEDFLLSTDVLGDKIDEGVQQILLSLAAAESDWVLTTAYADQDRVSPTADNGFFFEAIIAGTSAGTEPVWPLTVGATIVDGTVTWQNAGYQGFAGTDFGALSKANIYSYLVSAKKGFKKANTWIEGDMVAVLPPEVLELIETSTELTHATDKGDDLIAEGFFGSLAGFKIMSANAVRGAGSAASPFIAFLGNTDCITYASQFTEGPEAIRLEGEFSTGVRGLMVYGATVTDRNAQAGMRWEIEI